jgi:hypothetical protein
VLTISLRKEGFVAIEILLNSDELIFCRISLFYESLAR